ncbi:MAG: tetratricopeptide repeat protein [Spirochaetaceae bacterium]|jgi:tetratricopeptide (TPR) repeat protein|nr:tetratricopeptide repeat protein [Spirochaetaceae bacterium]
MKTSPCEEAPAGFSPGKLGYITIPDSLKDLFILRGEFSLDFSIPLPVELPPGTENFSAGTLTVEMFLSGILRDLAENPQGRHSSYYRELAGALRPDMPAELLGAAVFKARNGDYAIALDILSLLEGLQPRRPEILLNRALVLEARALALENTAKPQEAEAAFAEAEAAYERALDTPLPDTFFKAGLFYRNRGNYRRAADCLNFYVNSEGAGTEGSGEGALPVKRHSTARKLLEEIKNNGLDDDAFREALELIRTGREEQGIRRAGEFLERRPGAGKGWFILGWGLRRLKRWKDGRACFEKALELGCDNPDTRNELAICLMEEGSLDRAEAELKKALRRNPDNVKLISNLGALALKQGREEEAEAFFRAALELDGEDPIARSWMGLQGEGGIVRIRRPEDEQAF